jgi:hypothetical protein
MIELYLSMQTTLEEIPQLKLIDIEGSENSKIYPSAFIKLGHIPWQQLSEGRYQGEFPFSIRVEVKPNHTSTASSPVLGKLKDSLSFINDIRDLFTKGDILYVDNIVLKGEDLKKQKDGIFTAQFDFTGLVQME